MTQLSFLDSKNEPIIAVLGEQQLKNSLNGQTAKDSFCVLTQDKLYWGGRHFFQNYVGDWKNSVQQSSEPISNITAVAYRRRNDPTRTRRSAMRLTLSVVAIVVISILVQRSGHRFNNLFFLLLTFLIALILSMMERSRAKKNVMLDIEFGCETLSIRTAWHDKKELDVFYNRLIQSVSEAHAKENTLSGMDTEETYGGKKIMAEFGGRYREQYLRDRKSPYGFCIITPGELHFGGAYSKRLLPGLWFRAKKMRHIQISSISEVCYGIVGRPFSVAVIYFLALMLVFFLTVGRDFTFFRNVIFNTGVSMLPVCPFWMAVLFREKRMIIRSSEGTFAFWTHQDSKDENRRFHKILVRLIEEQQTNRAAQGETPRPSEAAEIIPEKPASPSFQEKAALLREYNQLLQEGIIDQTEFDRVKQEILSNQNNIK